VNSLAPTLKPDGRQSVTALMVQRGVCRLMHQHGFASLTEFTMASGRRADVIGLSPEGLVWIVEIKSSAQDFLSDHKWHEYGDYCDRFAFAIPVEMQRDLIPQEAGLLVADQFGAEIIRQLPDHPLHASRRKALTLQFSRMAAQRLHALFDPAGQ
jgi:hypothetical protein